MVYTFITTVFHELEHRLQPDYPQILTNQNSIYPMMYQIEQFLISTYQHEKKYDEYARLHDRFISEIDADIKGNKNLKAFANQYRIPITAKLMAQFETKYKAIFGVDFNPAILKHFKKSKLDNIIKDKFIQSINPNVERKLLSIKLKFDLKYSFKVLLKYFFSFII